MGFQKNLLDDGWVGVVTIIQFFVCKKKIAKPLIQDSWNVSRSGMDPRRNRGKYSQPNW